MIFSSVHLPTSNIKEEIKSDNQNVNSDSIKSLALQSSLSSSSSDFIIGEINKNKKINFFQLTNYLYIINAYLDLRKGDEYYIRFLTLINRDRFSNVNLQCKFDTIDGNYPAIPYEFNENHGLAFGGYIHSCKIPSNLINQRKVILHDINSGKSQKISLKILNNLEKSRKKFNFTLCVPPLFGVIDSKKLIAFIELNGILGAEHFYFYNYSVNSAEVKKVLNYYIDRNIVTVFDWLIPSINVWYNGQMSAIHHCLYENIGLSQYTIFQDLDELLTPMKVRTWSLLMKRIDDGTHSGYKIPMAFMGPAKGPLMYLESTERSLNVDHTRSKCIVIPHLIFEQGIHHISKQNVEEFTPKKADTAEVMLLHFRLCSSMFGFICSGTTSEKRLKIYEQQFLERYNLVTL